MPARRTIHFVSLGCPKNRVDTEVMLGVSASAGYATVNDPADADVIVVNTCGFIEAAKQESIDTVLALSDHKTSGRCRRLVVAGCLSQRYPDALADELPEVDHFLGSSDMLVLGRLLGQDAGSAPRMLVGNPADYVFKLGDPRQLSSSSHSAYLKVAEGCSRACSFCAIPSFRGTQRSRPVDDVVGEARRLVDAGTVELNLISQDTIAYGRDLPGGRNLIGLVDALEALPGLCWLRLFYLYPERFPEGLVERLAAGGKLVPYVDMPLQHASDAMLTRMRRGHRADGQRRLIEQLRAEVPGVNLRTSFIVGHPGETDADFEALCELVRWAEFDHLGVFRYSHEDGTHSFEMDDLVDEALARERASTLMELQRGISARRLAARVGQRLEVMVEGVSDESELLLQGRHAGQAPDIDGVVLLTNGTAGVGDFVEARVVQAGDYDLVAEIVDTRSARDGNRRRGLRVVS